MGLSSNCPVGGPNKWVTTQPPHYHNVSQLLGRGEGFAGDIRLFSPASTVRAQVMLGGIVAKARRMPINLIGIRPREVQPPPWLHQVFLFIGFRVPVGSLLGPTLETCL